MSLHAAIAAWRALLGAPFVLSAEQANKTYGHDTGGASRAIAGALRIVDAERLPEVMRIASMEAVGVYPISTGNNWGYGSALPARDGCVILDLSGLTRILHFDAELGVITVQPGVTQGMLGAFLDAGAYPYMVPTTGAGPSCSLLGNALERGYGITPHADHFGAVTDLEAVLADGTVYRTALRDLGGDDLARLFKWGIGPYTAGLFTQGGRGIVTRMSILLARRPECVRIGLFSLRTASDLERVVPRVRDILANLPGTLGGINLMNQHRVLAMAAPFPSDLLDAGGLIPLEVIAAMGRSYQVLPWTGFMTLYGRKSLVSAAQTEIRQALRGTAARLIFLGRERATKLSNLADRVPGRRMRQLSATLRTLMQSLELVEGRPNETALTLAYWRRKGPLLKGVRHPARDGCGLLWYAPLVPMRAELVMRFVAEVRRITCAHRIEPLLTLTSISERLFDATVPLLFDRDDPARIEEARTCLASLVEAGRALGCYPYRFNIDQQAQAGLRLTTGSEQLVASGAAVPGRYTGV